MPRRPTGKPNGRPKGSTVKLESDPDRRLLIGAHAILRRGAWKSARSVFQFLMRGKVRLRRLDEQDIERLSKDLGLQERSSLSDELIVQWDMKHDALRKLMRRRKARIQLEREGKYWTLNDLISDPKKGRLASDAFTTVTIQKVTKVSTLSQKYERYIQDERSRELLDQLVEDNIHKPASWIWGRPAKQEF